MDTSPIRSVGATGVNTPAVVPLRPLYPSAEKFDPFGPVYQAALRAAGIRPAGAPWNDTAGVTPTGSAFAADATPTVEVPTELQQYGNGRIPQGVLTPIGQGNHRLWAPAAASYQSMAAAARADGVDLRVTDSYRGYDNQVLLAQRKGLTIQGGLAAVPGTSNHGWGLAVDFDLHDPATATWVRTHAGQFGWVQASAREPWHWEFPKAVTGGTG